MIVLCFNIGSSSLRVAAYRARGEQLTALLAPSETQDDRWRGTLPASILPDAIVHRIVRGVKTGVPVEPYTEDVAAEIRSMRDLAPTHDPRALDAVAQSAAAFPGTRQFVAYDTAFHATIPAVHSTYAIPQAWRALGVRRIGYHGLSCAYAAQWLRANGAPKRAIHAHLGNGCSVTGLIDGRSAATTMGFTPLEGLVMGTRSGSVDPGALLFLLSHGVSAGALRDSLYRESGLRALCGTNDMREIEKRRAAGDSAADLAFQVFTASASAAIAQIAASIGGVEALVFAGGIGFHSTAVREQVCTNLSWMGAGSRVAVHALDVEEERMMALAVLQTQLKPRRESYSQPQ